MRNPLIIVLSLISTLAHSQPVITPPPFAQPNLTLGTLPTYNDAWANWSNAGLQSVGGIPNRTTICATVNPIGGGTSDATNIKNALASCPANEVVQLGSSSCAPNCAFTVYMADLPISVGWNGRTSAGFVVRGFGTCNNSSVPYCQTSITVADGLQMFTGGTCSGGTCTGFPVFIVTGMSDSYAWAQCNATGASTNTGLSCGAAALGADAAKGQTTIQVSSTSGFSVGGLALIDEASGVASSGYQTDPMTPPITSCTTLLAASDWLSTSPTPATGRVMYPSGQGTGCAWPGPGSYPIGANAESCAYAPFCDRVTNEIHQVTAVGPGPCPGANCTLTFTTPLTIAYRISGSHNAQVYPGPTDSSRSYLNVGMLMYAGMENLSILRGPSGGIVMMACGYCWVKNVEVSQWYGSGITVAMSWRVQLDTVLIDNIWNSVNSGGEYPIHLDKATTEMLVQNSIFILGGGKGMVARAGGAGSVVAYNYQDDHFYNPPPGIGPGWIDMGLNATHFAGPHHVLFEGNWGTNCDGDHTHGNSVYITFYRNQCAGYRTTFVYPPDGSTQNDITGVAGPRRAIGPQAFNYWYAFVGNVLGISGVTTSANGWGYSGDPTKGNFLWSIGWNDNSDVTYGLADGMLNGTLASAYHRHGNYDYVNGSIVDWQSGYTRALPNSYYATSRPSYFGASGTHCTYPWPWVTVTAGSVLQSPTGAGCAATDGLPAKARWAAGTPFVQP